MELRLNIHGIEVQLQSFEEKFSVVLDWLGDDLGYFRIPALQWSPSIRISLRSRRELTSDQIKRWERSWPIFRTRMGQAYGFFTRAFRLDDEHWVLIRPRGEIEIYGENPTLIYEAAFSVFLSRIGEELEKKHWLRLHALGVSHRGGAHIVLLPSGGGKSFLASQSLQNQIPIFSDEMLLYDGERIHPFPLRIALHPPAANKLGLPPGRIFQRKYFDQKQLYPINPELVASASAPGKIYSGHRGGKYGALWVIFWGLGLPQMREYFLRGENIFWLPLLAWQRARLAIRLFRQTPFGKIQLHKESLNNFDKLNRD